MSGASSAPIHAVQEGSRSLDIFFRFVAQVLERRGVRKIGWVPGDGDATLLVLMDDDDSPEAEEIHLLYRDLHQELFPLEVRIVSLAHVNEEDLPLATMHFQRG